MTIQEIHQGLRTINEPVMAVARSRPCWWAGSAACLGGRPARVLGPDRRVGVGRGLVRTFGWILVPGIGVGALLGWAEQLRSSGGRRGWRWLALAPLLFSAILFSRPLDLLSIFEDGVGGGAIGVSLYGLLGGTRCRVEDHAGLGSSAAPWP
jgi:hypothetical protein